MRITLGVPGWMRYFGLAGSLIPLCCTLAAALLYRGKKGERYSPLNHFVSELGERGTSRAAPLFNGGLAAGGILMIPFFVWLGASAGSPWGLVAAAAGIWASVSCSLVGFFPMNNLAPHIRAATSYFRGGLAAVVLCTLAIVLQPAERIPREAAAGGAVAAASYAAFLVIATIRYRRRRPDSVEGFLDPESVAVRPAVWIIPAVEWLVFASTVGWFLAVSLQSG
jgi:hypothetical membrane protein